ncbi:MAG: DedA family protein [Gammaproteobacteria bacterium]|nr:DedA family protein [Gammaproteobacteria bacterium]
MQLFSSLYERVMRWAAHRHAQWYLAGLSFAESSFFPIPPDVMLAPMALANTKKAWRYALITTVFSVLGGLAGYAIGMFAFDLVRPVLEKAGYMDNYNLAVSWFEQWGVWVIFVAGFSPIPYKLFTIAAGVVSMALLPFAIASIIGRGARFFIVAGLMVWGGEKMDQMLRQYVDRIGWALVVVVAIAFIWYEFM